MYVPKLIVCLREYSWSQFRSDLSAGFIVGLVALPLGMAFAIASGLPPERGLYTAVVAGFVISAVAGVMKPFFTIVWMTTPERERAASMSAVGE